MPRRRARIPPVEKREVEAPLHGRRGREEVGGENPSRCALPGSLGIIKSECQARISLLTPLSGCKRDCAERPGTQRLFAYASMIRAGRLSGEASTLVMVAENRSFFREPAIFVFPDLVNQVPLKSFQEFVFVMPSFLESLMFFPRVETLGEAHDSVRSKCAVLPAPTSFRDLFQSSLLEGIISESPPGSDGCTKLFSERKRKQTRLGSSSSPSGAGWSPRLRKFLAMKFLTLGKKTRHDRGFKTCS